MKVIQHYKHIKVLFATTLQQWQCLYKGRKRVYIPLNVSHSSLCCPLVDQKYGTYITATWTKYKFTLARIRHCMVTVKEFLILEHCLTKIPVSSKHINCNHNESYLTTQACQGALCNNSSVYTRTQCSNFRIYYNKSTLAL